ncbi:hypothetical protein SETIT_8G231400v2 [Setaria italica]|uniref:Knottin scorpion toxin-like domain-containing protein n=2 Tax=Setaria TaxID=4554 RepID=A0A368SAQ0_SETIT|nr:hypothetical protein SETIT_8G231400v2 [Setaria italica]TKW02405.1 hypothetical protein SEVIR_8G241800v2 [Setaria viridis]
MAHSAGKTLSAVLLLVAIAAVGGRIHGAESPSVGDYRGCNDHPSSNYKGACFIPFNDIACKRVCLDESSDNISGYCYVFLCWCQTRCTSETVAAASAPIPS